MASFTTMQGNLVADPTHRVTASGATVTRFRIASSERRQDKQTGEWVDGDPSFINVTCWRALGANVLTSLRKGDSVLVYGRLVYREYDDRQNVHRREHEVDAIAVGPDLNRRGVDIRREPRAVTAPADLPGAEPVASPVPEQPVHPFGETAPVAADSAA